MTGRVSGQDVNVNPERNEPLKCLCTILIFECIWCLDGAKVILELQWVTKVVETLLGNDAFRYLSICSILFASSVNSLIPPAPQFNVV